MPLLGRHKSLPAGANQAKSEAQQQPKPLVCESPLFGTRRQLPVATAAAAAPPAAGSQNAAHQQRQQQQAGSKRQSLSARNSSGATGAARPQASALDAAETLGSIPKQITRQQIHYAFSIMDTNSDGLIDLRDLSQMLANLGVPIDEAILSHVMSSVSKRGDHRISEREFLEWIGNFIQVSDLHAAEPAAGNPAGSAASRAPARKTASSPAPQRAARAKLMGGRLTNPLVRSASSTSALVAQSVETQQLIGEQLSRRRGSGSGLALMRSLSSSDAGQAKQGGESAAVAAAKTTSPTPKSSTSAGLQALLLAEQQREAQNDLKAAFCVFDLDGDGFITLDEVQKGLKLLGESWSLAELNQLLFSKCASAPAPARAAPAGRRAAAAKPAELQRISIDDFVKLLL